MVPGVDAAVKGGCGVAAVLCAQTDDALCDLLNYKYEISGDTALGIFKISEDGTRITYGDYLFVLSNNENGIATDVYKKK